MAEGYIAAFITVAIWGLTFVFTKSLLVSFSPVEILFIRFLLGTIALALVMPKRLKTKGWQEEKYLISAGLTGIFLYYFLENVSMLWTTASNAGVIVSTAPFFTALLSKERKSWRFFAGFAVAITGIAMISLSSIDFSAESLKGDLLALSAAFVWAFYAIASKKIASFGYSPLLTVRRSFIYGMAFMLIPLILWNNTGMERDMLSPWNITGLLFLGLAASALCFVLWNIAVEKLGPIRTSIFIYLVPVITVIASAVILGEKITAFSIIGTILTLSGLFLSGFEK